MKNEYPYLFRDEEQGNFNCRNYFILSEFQGQKFLKLGRM